MFESCEVIKYAFCLNGESPVFYNTWGAALKRIGDYRNDIGAYYEACKKFKLAIKSKIDYAEAYYNWGTALIEIFKIKKNFLIISKAIENYNLAIQYKEDFVEAYFEAAKAIILEFEINNTFMKLQDARKKLKMAISYRNDFAEAYFFLGWIYMLYGLRNSNPTILAEACKNFESAILNKKDYCEAYSTLAITIKKYGEFSNSQVNGNEILVLLTIAFLHYIIKRRWVEAKMIIDSYFMNSIIEGTDKYNRIYFTAPLFSTILALIIDPNENLQDIIPRIKEYLDSLEKRESYKIIADALIRKRAPEIQIDQDSDDLELQAAIVMANEIMIRYRHNY